MKPTISYDIENIEDYQKMLEYTLWLIQELKRMDGEIKHFKPAVKINEG